VSRKALALLIVLALAGTAVAWKGGGWFVHKFRQMHGMH
jgi:predicted nucleic acid-binding Zn ribbon protein